MKQLLENIERSDAFTKEGRVQLENFAFTKSEEVREFTGWLLAHRGIRHLSLRSCNLSQAISTQDLSGDGLHESSQFFTAVSTSPTLRQAVTTKVGYLANLFMQKQDWLSVDLSSNKLTQHETSTILQRITTSQTQLRSLTLSNNALGKDNLNLLAKYLANNKSDLTHLSLQYCVLKPLQCLIDGLKDNNTVRRLDLAHCSLSSQDLELLICLVKNNPTLVTITLFTDDLPLDRMQDLQLQLRKNQASYQDSLLNKLFRRCSQPDAAQSIIIQHREKPLDPNKNNLHENEQRLLNNIKERLIQELTFLEDNCQLTDKSDKLIECQDTFKRYYALLMSAWHVGYFREATYEMLAIARKGMIQQDDNQLHRFVMTQLAAYSASQLEDIIVPFESEPIWQEIFPEVYSLVTINEFELVNTSNPEMKVIASPTIPRRNIYD